MASVSLEEELQSAQPIPSARPRRSLRGLVLRGSAWTLAGYAGAQGLRLAGNLILTRLLAPEIFGLTAIISLFLQALEMFSDIGLASSIIRSPRGDEPEFLNTVWTMQVVRGFLLWLGSIVIAWPVAVVYGAPQLSWLLPVGGLSALILGFGSTAPHSCNRHMTVASLTAMEICAQAITIAATASLAMLRPTVWAIIGGGIIGAVGKTILSFTMLPDSANRPAWDRSAIAEILQFGKWLTLSTILTFFAGSSDRLILGYVLSKSEMGIYSIAYFMSQAMPLAIRTLSSRIVFPLHARLGELGANERRSWGRLHAAILAVALPPMCVLAIWGPKLIDLLYDSRYHSAGWMLRILSAGSIVAVITMNAGAIVLARGNSRLYMILLAQRSAVLLGAMLAGGQVAGTQGLIVGVALEPVICYPVMALVSRRYGAWLPWIDLAALLGSAALIALGLGLIGV